ncbi:MAG: glycosyltransferase family 25 protein [Campylobacter sp.]|nr:glycosyltransferase family 25 protein [Campylobacter sp.]
MKYPIYLISLQKDHARREALKSRFASFNDFNIINAIDGRNLSAKEYFSYANPSLQTYKKLLSPAEVGCSLSHMSAYSEFLKSGAKFALILEDDVIGDDSDIQKAFEMAENLSENSLFICGCQDGLNARFSAFGKKILDDEKSPLFSLLPCSISSINRTAAYILTQSSAKALLQTHQKALATTDAWEILAKKNNLSVFFADIFSHPLDLGDSNIEKERNERGYKTNLNAYIKSFKFILVSRFAQKFKAYERIFKDKK